MGLSFEKLRADSRNSRRVENERETSRMCSSKKSFGHSVPGRAIKMRHVTECAQQAGAPLSLVVCLSHATITLELVAAE